MIKSAITNHQIIIQMIKREILSRYRGSVLGLLWSFFTPLLMLGVYTFFFSTVFKARWSEIETESYSSYTLILFVGLIIHTLFAECINRAPLLITGNVNFVKKVVFPLEVLPWITMGSALFHAGISLVVLLLGQLLLCGHLAWTILLFPVILAPYLLMLMGFLWFLASMGVYLRDITQTTGLITSVLLFISPVFYSLEMLPAKMRMLAMLNPLTVIIIESRKVLLFSEMPNWNALKVYSVCSIVIVWMGFIVFQKTRKGFADVL